MCVVANSFERHLRGLYRSAMSSNCEQLPSAGNNSKHQCGPVLSEVKEWQDAMDA